jgi:oxygen-independent coproporphyrinogen III oxidase
MQTQASALIEKYNVPVPRYTSYPTVPFWDQAQPDLANWRTVVRDTFSATNNTEGISLYIHLPFCESLCTYCGCNKRITKNHNVEPVYITAVLKEWNMYLAMLGAKPQIREIHLGGGTPTFFSPEQLSLLINGIMENSTLHPDYEFSFEGHPNNTTREHLQTLYDLGFRRVSYGVQDLSFKVQTAINRLQPYKNVVEVTQLSREIGYESVNFDLIYGLPFQTQESIRNTFEKVIALHPDRIAFYSYAHVPWLQKSQRAYSEADLPADDVKYALYETGKNLLLDAGYIDAGMDHFAHPDDSLNIARQKGLLHRNFMGYTTNNTSLLLGLGVSSISDAYKAYGQNVKTVEEYYERINNGELPVFKGYFHTQEDVLMRRHILDIACTGTTTWKGATKETVKEFAIEKLEDLERDGLITLGYNSLQVTEAGWRFIRNICSAFDLKLTQKQKEGETRQMFSKAV